MRVAIECAGFTPGEADMLRKSMATFKHTGGVSKFRDKLISGMRFIRAETPGPVQGVGPPGTFSAGRMLITARETEGDEAAARSRPPVHLLFTDGVKLLYDPTKSEE